MRDTEPAHETGRPVGAFEEFADQAFERAKTESAITHWEWIAESGSRRGEERESVKYVLTDETSVEIWRAKDPDVREEADRPEPFIEYWINRARPMRLGLTSGAKVQRYNFHIGVCADGEYLESPETMTLSADALRTVLSQVIENIDELDLPDEPWNLGFQFLPLDEPTVQRVLEEIALPE